VRKKSILVSFRLVCFTAFFSFFSGFLHSQSSVPLTIDSAIHEAADYINETIPADTKVAIVNIQSQYSSFSDYIIQSVTNDIVNARKLKVVERNLTDVQNELIFQASGEVSDDTAKSIGHLWGADVIIFGSFSAINDTQYQLYMRAIDIETGEIKGSQTYIIKKDTRLSNLLPKAPKAPKTVGGKIGTGALNLIFGLGSYLDGDWGGGLTLTSGYAVTAGLFVIEATVLDWDNPAVGVPATLGIVVGSLTVVYGFVRPFIYNRNPKAVAFLDNTHFDIVPVSDTEKGDSSRLGVRIAYSYKF
jgi:hypothetical protein